MEWGIIEKPSFAASKFEEKKRVDLFMIMEIQFCRMTFHFDS